MSNEIKIMKGYIEDLKSLRDGEIDRISLDLSIILEDFNKLVSEFPTLFFNMFLIARKVIVTRRDN